MKTSLHYSLKASLLAIAGLAICLGSIPSASAEIIDRIVARVNDDIITKHDVRKGAKPYLVQRGMKPSALDDPQQRKDIYKRVLRQLINQKLIIQKAGELNLSVDDSKVSTWIKRTRQKQKLSRQQFKRLIERYGLDFADYRDQIRQNLLKMKVVRVKLGSQVSISDQRVDEVYNQEYSEDAGEETYISLEHILLRPDQNTPEDMEKTKALANKVRRQLDQGGSFAELARKYSDGPAAKDGGKLGQFTKGQLQEEVEKHAFDLDVGQLSNVIRTRLGFHIMRVTEKGMKASSNVRQKKNRIRGRLRRKAMQDEMKRYLDELREKAFIEINWP